LLTVLSLSSAACGSGAGSQQPAAEAPGTTPAPAADSRTIRLALPPDPLWQWLVDSGTLADWEAEHELHIEVSHPFRPFTALINGDADVILINAFDLPVFAHGLDSDAVIFGKHSSDRSIAAARRTSQASDLAGVVEGQIAMESQFGSALLWSLIVEQSHSLDFSDTGDDFEFMLTTSGVADAVERGDADACICLPDASIESLSTEMLRPLYDGKPAAQIYAEMNDMADHWMLGDVFAAERDWHRANPQAAADFLALWEMAVHHWHAHYPEIVAAYPELLSVQTQQHVNWLTRYLATNNWIAPSVYLAAEDSWGYVQAVSDLQARGRIPQDAELPSIITNRVADHYEDDHEHSEGGQ
jgi:ABC-type nitrate/sulfonate/bicarbonate transport system substrate-binding protein